MDLVRCEYDPPEEFDAPELLERLYGKHFDPNDKSGSGNIVVLGMHNSGTSIATRMIMLLGAFGGNFETISINYRNKLKYYESFSVALFHDAFLGKFVDTRFRPYHAQNLNFTDMTDKDRRNFECFARKHYEKDVGRHLPSVTKDPRMALTMPFWRPYIDDLVCVFVHKDPISNSVSLAKNAKKSARLDDTDVMSSKRWLDTWESSQRQALEGCRGRPMVLFDSKMIREQGAKAALQYLLQELSAVGVKGLAMPGEDEIHRQITRHFYQGPRIHKLNARMRARFRSEAAAIEIDDSTPEMTPQQAVVWASSREYRQTADCVALDDIHSGYKCMTHGSSILLSGIRDTKAACVPQMALETAIAQHIRDAKSDNAVDPKDVADSIMNLAKKLESEYHARQAAAL